MIDGFEGAGKVEGLELWRIDPKKGVLKVPDFDGLLDSNESCIILASIEVCDRNVAF